MQQHTAVQHITNLKGLEARSCVSSLTFPRHAHDQFGIGVMVIGAHRTWSGRGHVEPEAGDVVTANPGEMHDGEPLGQRPRGWRMLYLDPMLMRSLLSEEGGPLEAVRPAIRDRRLAKMVSRAFHRATSRKAPAMSTEEELLPALVHATRGPVEPPRHTPCVGLAMERIRDAPAAPATLKDLAGLAGVSRFQFLRAFAREVGLTPHRYLVQARVEEARRMLVRGETLASAAIGAGFADQSHMSRAFLRQFGVTPAKYRSAVLQTPAIPFKTRVVP